MEPPQIVQTTQHLRNISQNWCSKGERIALVPTMGALHAGHRSLLCEARARADRVIASIFVNPLQFGPAEDLKAYPRPFEKDYAILEAESIDLIFHPSPSHFYPEDYVTSIEIGGPAKVGLEDRFRPAMFRGVATVLVKLFMACLPHQSYFGEKDYQQLCVVRQLVRDLDLPIDIMGLPTQRETDGLALSSRNAYLSEKERAQAPSLYEVLCTTVQEIQSGKIPSHACAEARETLTALGFDVDYVELRDAQTLSSPSLDPSPRRLLAAARLGTTRLIDNVAL